MTRRIVALAVAAALTVPTLVRSPESARAFEFVFEGTTRFVAIGVPANPADLDCDNPQFSTLDYAGDEDQTIQAAIDASSDGDTVHICAGEWNLGGDPAERQATGDHLNTNSTSLRFEGDGRDETILVGSPFDDDDAVRIFSSAEPVGGGDWEPLEFADMEIRGGAVNWHGGAVAAAGVRCERVDFIDNVSDPIDPDYGNGGAIYSEGDVYIDDCLFDGNYAENNGGAIAVVNGDLEIVNGSEFIDNDADNAGGAVWVYQDAVEEGTILIEDSTFTSNSAAGDMGAVAFYNTDQVAVRRSSFTANTNGMTAGQAGGALGGYGDLEVFDTTFSGNNGDYVGGAIFIHDLDTGTPTTLTVTSSVFEDNEAMIGGAIYAGDTMVSVTSSSFGRASESGSCSGEEPEFGNAAIEGGAILIESVELSASLDVRGSSFYYNCAINFGPDDGSGDGGAIAVANDAFEGEPLPFELNVESSRFIGNGADSDGGAIFSSNYSLSLTRIVTSTFTNNASGLDREGADEDRGQGGAIRLWFANHKTQILGNRFTLNAADQGGAVSINDGGGDDPLAHLWTVRRNRFSRNTATDSGGALHMALDNSGRVAPRNVDRNTFTSNRAPLGGAIVVESDVGTGRAIQRRFVRALADNRYHHNRASADRRSAVIGVHFDE